MGLAEMMRVMDVATTLRQEQELVEREFNVDQTKQMLRDKLKRTAELTGEELTDEQVEAAVNWYYDNLHEYEEPKRSFKWFLAHAYVRRTSILAVLGTLLALGLGIWGLWLAPFAPLSEANQIARQQQAEQQQLIAVRNSFDKNWKSASSVADSESVNEELGKLKREADAYFDNKDKEKLSGAEKRVRDIFARVNEDFTITVVGGENTQSAFPRNYTDSSGTRLSGYYLIVEARNADGNVIPRQIHNVENDTSVTVTQWAERVPKSVFDRLKQDKQEDGVLNETTFGKKTRGKLKVEMIMTDQNNLPITRTAQITDW